MVRYKKSRDFVVKKEHLSIHGIILLEIHFGANSLKEAVLEEQRIRLKFFRGKNTTKYGEDWPKF